MVFFGSASPPAELHDMPRWALGTAWGGGCFGLDGLVGVDRMSNVAESYFFENTMQFIVNLGCIIKHTGHIAVNFTYDNEGIIFLITPDFTEEISAKSAEASCESLKKMSLGTQKKVVHCRCKF